MCRHPKSNPRHWEIFWISSLLAWELCVSLVWRRKIFFQRSCLPQGMWEQERVWEGWEVHPESAGGLWCGAPAFSQHFGITNQGLSRGDAASSCGGWVHVAAVPGCSQAPLWDWAGINQSLWMGHDKLPVPRGDAPINPVSMCLTLGSKVIARQYFILVSFSVNNYQNHLGN